MAHDIRVRRVRASLRSGEQVTIPAWTIDSGKPGPCFLLTAAQHGNEVQGSETIRRFVNVASAKMKAGRVIAIPFANIPALRDRRPHIHMGPEQPYSKNRRHNMNTTWPGRAKGNDTARVSYAIEQAFGDQATHVLDLHCWSKFTSAAVLTRERPGMRQLARKLGHRFVQVRQPSDTTLSGRFCAKGRVGVTYEFSGQYLIDEEEVRRGLRLATNMGKAIGLLPGRLEPGDRPVLFSDETETTKVLAPCSGLFVGRGLKMGQRVSKGMSLPNPVAVRRCTLQRPANPMCHQRADFV